MSEADYTRFLSVPSAALLDDEAKLHYVTTLTTLTGSSKIIANLNSKELKRTKQKVISAVEDGAKHTLAVEVETTLEFVTGAGAYLPGLDDNFLTDRTVTFPIIHFVHFTSQGKIDQIRQLWDQGSLLKQIEVIGVRGRNWPIKDGPELIKFISSAQSSLSGSSASAANKQSSHPDEVIITSTAPKMSGAIKHGPQQSLSLFEPISSKNSAPYSEANPPKSSAKPPPRDYSELFPSAESDQPNDATPVPNRTQQQQDGYGNLPKAGGGQNYQPSRLFSEGGENVKTPEKNNGFMKTDPTKYKHFDLGIGGDAPEPTPYKISPQKYNHFEFGDGEDGPVTKSQPATIGDDSNPILFSQKEPEQYVGKVSPTTAAKHQSQWDFADFTTPAKPAAKSRGQDARHFGWSYSDDEEPAESPIKHKSVVVPRRDADTHFTFTDVNTPEKEKTRPTSKQAPGADLYKDTLYSGEGENQADASEQRQRPLSTVTNMSAHRKVFESHFSLEDESPVKSKSTAPNNEKRGLADDRKKAVNMMSANWDMYDQSPKENRGIRTAGDGMGGRRGATTRNWGFGNEDEEEPATTSLRDMPKAAPKPVRSENWDF